VAVEAMAPGRMLLTHLLAVHAVDGHGAGLYRWSGSALETGPAVRRRRRASCPRSCAWASRSAATVPTPSSSPPTSTRYSACSVRAAHAEAGIVNGRLLPCAHALGHGATGLTFFDEAVRGAFETTASCLLVAAVGAPSYRSRPGGWPRHPVELAGYDALMTRLQAGLRR
jgi:hypothetical protein